MPKNESNDPAFEAVKKSAKQLIERYEQTDENSVEEWEVDELLEWTNGLDFNSYHNHWQRIGTTKSSNS